MTVEILVRERSRQKEHDMKRKILLLTSLSLSLSNAAYGQAFDIDAKIKSAPSITTPAGATSSGKCDISFDVDIDGRAKNIEAKSCTNEIFYLPSIRSLQATTFTPATQGGTPTIRRQMIKPVEFSYFNADGNRVLGGNDTLYYPPRGEVFSPLAEPITVAEPLSGIASKSTQFVPIKSNHKFSFEFLEGNAEKSADLFYGACISALQNNSEKNVSEKICEEKRTQLEKYNRVRHKVTPDRIYKIIASADKNSQIFEDKVPRHLIQTGFGNSSAISGIYGLLDSRFMTKQNKKLNYEALDQVSISLETIAWETYFTSPSGDNKYGLSSSLIADEVIRYTAKKNGVTLIDTTVEFPIYVANMRDCSPVTKKKHLRKCKERYDASIWVASLSKEEYFEDNAYHTANGLFAHSPSIFAPFFDSLDTINGELHKEPAIRFARGDTSEVKVNSYTLKGRVNTSSHDYGFEIIDGARAQLEVSKLGLLKDSDIGPKNYASDSRYAGDVQRCIVEVRNSLRSDQTTGNVLSGIARLAGAGTAADILDTTNRAINTYDNLNGTERKEVDACMRRKGH